jgi:5-(aminomethyl)-3-furanmethanol phosphate kinase
MNPLIVKVGGSLFDLPDLATRLRGWLAAQTAEQIIVVPGGGAGADVVRKLDAKHNLGVESAHWLALHVLSVNGRFLARLLGVPFVPSWDSGEPLAVLDALEFCARDDGRAGALAHSWDTTSDSIAARIAHCTSGRLALLKSVDLPVNASWSEAAAIGLVDRTFPTVVAHSGIDVAWVNLRQLSL